MSKFTVENMRDIQPILNMFKKPEKMLEYRLEKTHLELAPVLEQKVEHVGLYRTYGLVNDLLIGIIFKLKTLYHAWCRGDVQLNNNELREVVLGVNYEIYEALHHTFSIAQLYLPVVQKNNTLWDAYRASLHGYIRRCNIVSPQRFANPNGLKDDIVLTDKEKEDLIAGRTLPSLKAFETNNYHMLTTFSLESIRETLDVVGDTGSVHPSIASIMKFCAGSELIVNRITPGDILLSSNQDIQEQLLLIIELIGTWDALTVASLFKDEQLLLEEYHLQKKKEDKLLSYQMWRENQLTKLITPDIMVATTYC